MNRRTFLKVLGGATAGAAAFTTPLWRAAADNASSDEFFIVVHASGGWDVTVGLDPRYTPVGIINPASTNNVDPNPLRLWKNATTPLDGGGYSYQPVLPPGPSPLAFGPGIGDMLRHYDRMTVVNGLNMATVAHADGVAFSLTGRHLAGSRPVQSSIDTMVADALGTTQLFPAVSVNVASSFVGNLDRRAVPLTVNGLSTVAASLGRSTVYDTVDERDAVTALLSQEAMDLGLVSADPTVMNGFGVQLDGLRNMDKQNLLSIFTDAGLRGLYPSFNYNVPVASTAAFAVEAMKRNVVRCVAFSYGSFDTHGTNYRQQPLTQQNLFDTLAVLIDYLDATPHPTKMGDRLSDHVHLILVSDFCRTPNINLSGGRDHYPNNSALVVSPKWKQNFVYGKADDEQLLPLPAGTFSDGVRAVAPPDLLATFLAGVGIDPHKYLRDGEVVKDLLA
jgi:hypothetical protein